MRKGFWNRLLKNGKPTEDAKVDPRQVKAGSERSILAAGGQVCDWLPILDRAAPRNRDAIVGRALVLNAMINIYFKAPTQVVKVWIDKHGVSKYLSPKEREILDRSNDELSDQEKIDLYWYIEALWALMWVGGLIDDLAFDRPIEDYMASLCPALQHDEDGSKFESKMRIRPAAELFGMLDLYYRLHWWTRNAGLNGQDTGAVRLDFVMERRKALEWVMDPDAQWDDVGLNT